MATLILNANTSSPLTISCQKAGKSVPRLVGAITTSFNGANRSSVRGQAKVIPILASLVDTATEATIQAACYNGAQIPCSGDILQNIQTLCSIDGVASNMVPGLPGFFEMSFTVSEVNASTVLLKYSPGDTITGEVFTRSNGAYQINASGVLVFLGTNVKRDGHYISGVRSLLLEDTRTNSILQSTAFNNVAWTKVTTTVTTGIADPAGATNACTLTATGANATTSQVLANGSSIVRSNSLWIKRRTGTGTVSLLTPDSGTFVPCTLTANWQSFSAVGIAAVNRSFQILIATNGDAIDVWNGQLEDGSFASSPIPTTTVPATRAADNYSFPFTSAPQELSLYAKFVESGSIKTTGARVAEITSAADADPRFVLFNVGSFYESFHNNGTAAVSSVLAAAPVMGNVVELEARLFADGSTDVTQSIASAAATSGAQSAADTLGTAWSGQLLYLNSGGTAGSVGFNAIQSFKVIAGARSLTEIRAA